MMKKYYIYVGANNETHELERDTIVSIVSKHFEGFTAYEVIGYWKGTEEKSLKIEIVANTDIEDTSIIRVCKELKTALKQDAVMLEKINSNVAFI
jgi:hypothetical protein